MRFAAARRCTIRSDRQRAVVNLRLGCVREYGCTITSTKRPHRQITEALGPLVPKHSDHNRYCFHPGQLSIG